MKRWTFLAVVLGLVFNLGRWNQRGKNHDEILRARVHASDAERHARTARRHAVDAAARAWAVETEQPSEVVEDATSQGIAFWGAMVIGIGVMLTLFFAMNPWFMASTSIWDFVNRVVWVSAPVIAVGALLQLGSHFERGHRFGELLGKSLVASAGVLVALATLLAGLSLWLDARHTGSAGGVLHRDTSHVVGLTGAGTDDHCRDWESCAPGTEQ